MRASKRALAQMGHGTETHKSKIDKYKAGEYLIPVPPVTPAAWNESDWIRFIDAKGKWL